MVKRMLDLLLAGLGLVVVAPVGLIAAVVVFLSEGRPVFYLSRRVGQGGREFTLHKLRTMVPRSDRGSLGSVTVADDARLSRTGRALRRWKLDELPQLVNVLKGEMSIVGPRPDAPEIVALYTDEQREILRYRPGLTSPASIRFVNEAELLATSDDPRRLYIEEIMPEEIRLDLDYMKQATVGSDLRVMLATVVAVFRGSGR